MRKYLLSLMVAVMGIALLGTTTFAFESKSIKSENTFEFYENEFDFMMMPAKLAGQDSTLGEGHKLVEGFTGYRLFTNLTNQSGRDAYQIGGIVPIPGGMGNIGVLFDYKKNEGQGPSVDCVDCGQAYLYNDLEDSVQFDTLEKSSESDSTYTDQQKYDTLYKDVNSSLDYDGDDAEEQVTNLYVGYGLAIPGTPVSVGLSYAYGNIDGENTDYDYNTYLDDDSLETPSTADKRDITNITADDKDEWEYETHTLALEGRFNSAPIDSLLGLSWKTLDGKNTSDNTSSSSYSLLNNLPNPPGPGTGDFTPMLLSNSLYSTFSGTSSDNNEGDNLFPFCGYGNRQGDKWSIYTENIFELNPTVAFGLDLKYAWGDYDDDLDGLETVTVNESGKVSGSGATQTATLTNTNRSELDGSIDNDELYGRFEVRLTFPQVRFGLGVAYDTFSEDGDYSGTLKNNYTRTYDDSSISTSGDYTAVGSATGSIDSEYSLDMETWSFPVSTEFNITERLVCRLGAEFVFGRWELDYEETDTINPDATFVRTYTNRSSANAAYYKDWGSYDPNIEDGNGVPVTDSSIAADYDGDPATVDPYDTSKNVSRSEFKDDDTFSKTIYNVGLGYQVTENLNVDAMWRHSDDHQDGEQIKREPVSTDLLFVGATLAF